MVLDAEQIGAWDYWDEGAKDQNVAQMVKEFAKVTGQKPSVTMSATLIQEEYAEWEKEFSEFGKSVKELKELADLVYVIYGYANTRHWNLTEAIERVHKNNIGRCRQQDGTIQRREDGKIIKNPDFPAVVLDDLV
jgi:predicted HAD superfamily Cof-like phosphohydrolase